MFWNSLMFWKVRPMPAATTSFGRALRKIPIRLSSREYHGGRMIASSKVEMSNPMTASVVSAAASSPRDGAPRSDGDDHRDDRRGDPDDRLEPRPSGAQDEVLAQETRRLRPIGSIRPATTLKKVVLPAPLGPMMLTIEPFGMSRLTSRTATRPPNRLVIERAWRR